MKQANSIPEIVIVQDTREQRGYLELFKGPCIIGTLSCGDYSIAGLEDRIALERKSLPDLLQSLTHNRERFEAELARARALDFFCVIVEASLPDVLNGKFGQYGAGCNPLSIWETVAAFTIRYCPFLFVGNRVTGVRLVESLLTKWVREHFKILQAIEKATKKLNRPVAEAIPF